MKDIFSKKKRLIETKIFAIILLLVVFDIAILGNLNLKAPQGAQSVPVTPVYPNNNDCTCMVGSSPMSTPPEPHDCGNGVIGTIVCTYICQQTTPACIPTPANLAGTSPTRMNDGKWHLIGCQITCPNPIPPPAPGPAPPPSDPAGGTGGTTPGSAEGCCTTRGQPVSTRAAGVTCSPRDPGWATCVPCNTHENCGPGATFP